MLGSSQGIQEPSTRRRGPYRSQAHIPRQTLHNRKKRKLLEAPSCTHAYTSVEEPPSITASETPSAVDTPRTSSTPPAVINVSDGDRAFSDDQAMQKLFSGSSLSLSTSHTLIGSFTSRHHLSMQAQEDLLHLMQLHLPSDNLLPSSLYMLRKVSESTNGSVEPTSHLYCPRSYTVLSDCPSTICPDLCRSTYLDPESTPSFTTISIAEQLKVLLKRKCM